jgi:hypothetical protein
MFTPLNLNNETQIYEDLKGRLPLAIKDGEGNLGPIAESIIRAIAKSIYDENQKTLEFLGKFTLVNAKIEVKTNIEPGDFGEGKFEASNGEEK